MPSFEDAGARSGYAIEFFCRARALADLFMDGLNSHYEFPEFWIDGLMETPMLGGCDGSAVDNGEEEPCYSMVSLGGGPGFDFVSAALATSFCSYSSSKDQESSHQNNAVTAIKATILDYEEGWGDLVQAMSNSTRYILQNSNLQCNWGGKCDITKSIFHANNIAISRQLLDSTNLWTCQYCVAENANLLEESKYIFFRELFQHANVGSLFVLSEVHPRLWPEFVKVIEESCVDMQMQIGFNRNGRQMLLRKGGTSGNNQNKPLISEKDQLLVQKFEGLSRYHERKIDSGWVRQAPKRRLDKEGREYIS